MPANCVWYKRKQTSLYPYRWYKNRKCGCRLPSPCPAQVHIWVYIFLRVLRPYTKIGSMWTVIAKYAHIALGKDQKMNGPHAFRRGMGRQLLEANIPAPLICDILGHSSSVSLAPIYRVILEKLKVCAGTISAIPIAQEALLWQDHLWKAVFGEQIRAFVGYKNSLGFPYNESIRNLGRVWRFLCRKVPWKDCLDCELALAWLEKRDTETQQATEIVLWSHGSLQSIFGLLEQKHIWFPYPWPAKAPGMFHISSMKRR